MDKESLKIVSDKLHILVDDPRINILDKAELIINLSHFLNPDTYEGNIEVLEEHRKKLILKEGEYHVDS